MHFSRMKMKLFIDSDYLRFCFLEPHFFAHTPILPRLVVRDR